MSFRGIDFSIHFFSGCEPTLLYLLEHSFVGATVAVGLENGHSFNATIKSITYTGDDPTAEFDSEKLTLVFDLVNDNFTPTGKTRELAFYKIRSFAVYGLNNRREITK